MNNYQIYDEIGKGRHSVVYKGRRKKSIEYFAIASIEKTQRQRVLTSVQFLRSLSHRNVLKFHNWYETNNHLWVITEYCVGGDLRAVLDLDQRLSETSVRVFGIDLVEGLMHIHSRGIIYGDLKPSNILMDATASLRYYDFGLSCSFEGSANASKVGTPSYMAPELFRDGGVPSMASDLWSLGCVLYEMATGRPPFSANSIQGLIQKIVNEPFRRAEGCSAAFQELVDSLLQKDPLERATWADVVANEFWQSKVSPMPPFPPQPSFEQFQQQHRPHSKEVEKRNKDIVRASINAERNIARELAAHAHGGGAYSQQESCATTTGGTGVLHLDREIDFGEHAESTGNEADTTAAAQKPPTPPTLEGGGKGTYAIGHVKQAGSTSPGPGVGVQDSDSVSFTPVEELLIHSSDAHIRPLVTNARIEKSVEQKFEPATLGFASMTLSALKQLPNKDLEAFLTTIYKSLSTPSSGDVSDKLNVLYYFESLCGDAAIANVVINSSVMTLCVKLVASSRGAHAFRTAVASIMGLLVRHATFIHSDLAKSNIVAVLVDALGEETSTKTIRKLLACLGELLFYIGTQSREERTSWPLDPSAIRAVYVKAMHQEDDVVKHYAVKAIENLASITDKSVVRDVFANNDVVETLLWIYSLPLLPPARTEHLKSSAVCAALKLCYADDVLVTVVAHSPHFPCQSYGEALSTCNAKIVQILISTVNVMLWRTLAVTNPGSHNATEVRSRHGAHATPSTSLTQDACERLLHEMLGDCNAFLGGLCAVLEHSVAAVRAKGLLCVSLLCTVGGGYALGAGASTRLFQVVDKLIKDKDAYVQSCGSMTIRSMCKFTEGIIQLLAEARHRVPPPVFVAALHTITAPNIRTHLAIAESLLVNLATCVRGCYAADTSSYYAPHEETLHHMIEALASDAAVRAHHYMTLASTVVQPYGELLANAEGSKRFSAIQMILQLLSPIVQDGSIYNPAASICPVVTVINEFVASIVPHTPRLLQDGEPIPLYTMKLLSLCCERSPTVTLRLMDEPMIELLLSFLHPTHPSNSVHVVKLLLRILQCGGEEKMTFAVERSLIPNLLGTMQRAKSDGSMEVFGEPCFELTFFVLCAAVNDPSSTVAQHSSHFIVEQRLEDLFFPVCMSKLGAASECAASSIFLLTQLFSEARQAILQPKTLGMLRDTFSDVDDASLHTTLPLLKALLLCISASSNKRELKSLQHNEPLLVVIHSLTESGLSSDLATIASELLQALYNLS